MDYNCSNMLSMFFSRFASKTVYLISPLVCLVILLTSCQPSSQNEGVISAASETSSVNIVTPPPTETPAPTATTRPEKNLVICSGQEPESLYVYGSSSQSTWDVLENIYDGPFDTQDFEIEPVILSGIPDFNNGGAVFTSVEVNSGDYIVDAYGTLTALQAGTVVYPSGCRNRDCLVEWNGVDTLMMDQLSLTYQLIEGVTWSDGTPLTSVDSVYSFNLSADPDTPVSKQSIYRTASYEALDEYTIKWMGVPGFAPQQYQLYFWIPLPSHIWSNYTAADLVTAQVSYLSPIGWGPYVIDTWVMGDYIRLSKNPNYYRLDQNEPAFDHITYKFTGYSPATSIDALLNGECDIVDQTSFLSDELDRIKELEDSGQITVYSGQGPEWEQLSFGILHSDYDDGYSWYQEDRGDYFNSPEVRQAITQCINRDAIVDVVMNGYSAVPYSYYAPDHSLYQQTLSDIGYDPDAGLALLDQIGWKDWDGDPETPLQSVGILNIPDGTYFELDYYTTDAAIRTTVADMIKSDLAQCGIQINIQSVSSETLYQAGSEGILFGRNYDLAQYSWEMGTISPCVYYLGDQIPTEENNWLTVNVGGYANDTFDRLCREALYAYPDDTEFDSKQIQVAELFNSELPVVPLYYRLEIAISRPDLCGLQLDVSSRSLFWNIESIDYGVECE